MQDYAVLKAFTRYGAIGTFVLCAAAVALAIGAAVAGFVNWPVAIATLVVVLVGGFLLLVFVDLTKVIQDMLMPR